MPRVLKSTMTQNASATHIWKTSEVVNGISVKKRKNCKTVNHKRQEIKTSSNQLPDLTRQKCNATSMSRIVGRRKCGLEELSTMCISPKINASLNEEILSQPQFYFYSGLTDTKSLYLFIQVLFINN